MYLKTIDLLGFKSFAQKTTLEFHRGVTAVVGPNGCGKSNVLDAIRWVLGEQSAKALRGGEMADVIFSGTDSRQALGMAEVSLTFADCREELGVEWDEVCITRRVFRDGSSAYFVNKAPCRLRDIHQMFMDTGIGRNAYSIMEQGKIDQILSSKPEERRAVFEEAAGITRFKSQKKEALRKLEATEANLLRVTDVIREVKRQIGSLQRQAAKARRYQALTADLRILETHFSHHQYADLQGALARAKEEIEKLTALHDSQRAEIERHENASAERRQLVSEKEHALSEARQAVQELKNRVAAARNRIAFNGERIRESESLVERYGLDVAAAEEKLRVQQSEIENADLEIGEISKTLAFEQSRLEEKNAAVNVSREHRAAREREAQELFRAIARAENEVRSLEAALGSAGQLQEQAAERARTLAEEIAVAEETVARLDRQHGEIERQIGEHAAQFAEANAQAASEQQGVAGFRSELASLAERLGDTRRRLAEKSSKLEVLRALNESGEGFAEGTQAVLRGLDNPDFFKPSLAGSLASQLDVPQEYVRAIEAALGASLEAVVVKDAQVAESIIKTLTHQKLGRASLAVREFVAAAAPDEERPPLPEGALAWASENVGASEAIRPLLDRLLSRCALVESLDRMLAVRSGAPGLAGVTLVTLQGEVLTPEGLLRGGVAGAASSSVLDRKNEIAALASEAAEIESAIAGLESARGGLEAEHEAAAARFAAAQAEARRIEVALSALRGQVGLSERERESARRQAEKFVREREDAVARMEKAEADILRAREAIESASSGVSGLVARREEAERALEAARSDEGVLGAELNDLRVKVATERQRLSSLSNQRQPMENRLQELRDLIRQRGREIGEYRERAASLGADCERIEGEIGAMETSASEADRRVEELAAERRAAEEEMEKAEADLRIFRRQIEECSGRRGQQEVRQTQIQLRMDNLRDHIRRRHDVDLDAFRPDAFGLACALRDQEKRLKKLSAQTEEPGAPEEAEPAAEAPAAAEATTPGDAGAPGDVEEQAIDWARAEQYVNEIGRRLDAMGPVNLDAIQEYEELEQRHTFLEQQVTDLSNAKAELLDVIAKINATTRTMFAETFEKIRANFQEMFTELFGGGKANLVLADESDPLESGIDIIARPPGKQLASITLLSGGEKTMTAVSLLFAIYMVKPSPFCVLDEMDAPLDESNINRFIKILDRFINQSQFVVITHNKRTIARADVIYGVTMEEHGISKLVGVRFSQKESSSAGADIMGGKNPSQIPSVAESFGKSGELHSEGGEKAG